MLRWTLHREGGGRALLHAAVAVERQARVYCFGGLSKYRMKVYVFDTVSLCWGELRRKRLPGFPCGGSSTMSRRVLHGYTAALIGDAIYIWGGWPEGRRLHTFDVDTHRWSKKEVSGTVPEGRWNHSACVVGKVMYVHGGCDLQLTVQTNDMYKLNTATMVWSLINAGGTPPPPSHHHSATIIGTKIFVFGCWGDDRGVYYNDIRGFDTETDRWLSTPPARNRPGDVWSHSAFAYNGELYIIGRHSRFPFPQNCLQKFYPEAFYWMKARPKGNVPSSVAMSCCCMVGDRVILFGGNKPDDLHILDLSPRLKTLCKLSVIQYGLEQSGLPHNIRWELVAMTTIGNTQ